MKWISHVEWSGEKQVEVKVEYFTSLHLDAYFEGLKYNPLLLKKMKVFRVEVK